jgi:hypothetical protein
MKSLLACLFSAFAFTACQQPAPRDGADAEVTQRGSIEVTARLLELPDGAVFQRDLYNYATILKYEVTAAHRGPLAEGAVIYVGHYNPWKPRAEAADDKVNDIGGTVREFRAGGLHRMALEATMDEHYLGGIVDKYFGQHEGPGHWAVWTNAAE